MIVCQAVYCICLVAFTLSFGYVAVGVCAPVAKFISCVEHDLLVVTVLSLFDNQRAALHGIGTQ